MSDEDDQIDRVAARRNGWRLLLLVGGLALLGGVVGVLFGVLRHDEGTGHAQHGTWFLILIVALVIVVSLAAAGGGLVWFLRRPSYQRVMQYGWSERRRTFQTIKAGRPLDPRQVRIARAALDYTQQRWLLWLLPVAIAIWLVNGYSHRDDLFGKVQLGLGVVYLLGLPFMFWQRRRVIERTRTALDRAQPS